MKINNMERRSISRFPFSAITVFCPVLDRKWFDLVDVGERDDSDELFFVAYDEQGDVIIADDCVLRVANLMGATIAHMNHERIEGSLSQHFY
jgi:hypothetical protein